MTLIKVFAEAVMDVAKHHFVSPINYYAEQLSNAIESFEIGAIKGFLNEFPQLIKQLEQSGNTDKASR